MFLFVMLVTGCSGASPSESTSGGDAGGSAPSGTGAADLSSVEPDHVHSGRGSTSSRNGAGLTVADEIRMYELGRVCVNDRDAGGQLCTILDEPGAAAISVDLGLENTSDGAMRLEPGDATVFVGALPAESADQYAQSFEATVVEPGAEVTGAMVWVLSGSIDEAVSAIDEGDYGLEFVVRGPDHEAVLTETIVTEPVD